LQVGLLNINIEFALGHGRESLHPSGSADGQPANLKAAEGQKGRRPQKEQHTAWQLVPDSRHDLAFHFVALFAAALNSLNASHLASRGYAKEFRAKGSIASSCKPSIRNAAKQQLRESLVLDPLWGLSQGEAGKKKKNGIQMERPTRKRRTTQEFLPDQKLIEWGPSHGTGTAVGTAAANERSICSSPVQSCACPAGCQDQDSGTVRPSIFHCLVFTQLNICVQVLDSELFRKNHVKISM
jgi:hypothetical protein